MRKEEEKEEGQRMGAMQRNEKGMMDAERWESRQDEEDSRVKEDKVRRGGDEERKRGGGKSQGGRMMSQREGGVLEFKSVQNK